MDKMTLDEFRKIKKAMIEYYESKKDEILQYKCKLYQVEGFKYSEYNDLLNKLLSSDLSEIPFEEWKGLYLSSSTLDLSKTHANIDFSLLGGISYYNLNCHGCNIKGTLPPIYDEDTFDSKFINDHPEIFPDKSVPSNVRSRFYDHMLTFLDLAKYPSLKNCAKEESFSEVFFYNTDFSSSYKLIKKIGFKNAMKIFNEYPNFIVSITDRISGYESDFFYRNFIFNSDVQFDEINNYKEAKEILYKLVIDEIKEKDKSFSDLLPIDSIPQEMMDSFPNIFIKKGELPEEITKKYYDGNLSIDEIRDYYDIFKTKDLDIGTRQMKRGGELYLIKEIFGNIQTYIEYIPENVDKIVRKSLDNRDYTIRKLRDKEIKFDSFDDLANYIIKGAIKGRGHVDNLEKLDVFTKYVSLDELLTEKEAKLIKKCGLDNLLEYNRNNNMVLDKTGLLNIISNTMNYYRIIDIIHDEDIVINNQQQLSAFFETIISTIRNNGIGAGAYTYKNEHLFKKAKENREILSVCPHQFIDYNQLDILLKDLEEKEKDNIIWELEEGFNGDVRYFFIVLEKYPFLATTLKNKELIIRHNSPLKKFYQQIGNEIYLEICSKYGSSIIPILDMFNDNEYDDFISQIKQGNYENVMNKCVYDLISKFTNSARPIDIRILPKSFKDEHPELYLDDDAPKELQDIFYGKEDRWAVDNYWYSQNQEIHWFSLPKASYISHHPEWVPFLKKIDLSICLQEVVVPTFNFSTSKGDSLRIRNDKKYRTSKYSLYKILSLNFSQEEILELISKYGEFFDSFEVLNLGNDNNKADQYNGILESIYKYIKSDEENKPYYYGLMPQEFIEKYSDIFISENAPEELKNIFYRQELTFEALKIHPEWEQFLQEKDIYAACSNTKYEKAFIKSCLKCNFDYSQILELSRKYGLYIKEYDCYVNYEKCDINEFDNHLRYDLASRIFEKNIKVDENIRKTIGDEFILDDNAPEELKKSFYHKWSRYSEFSLQLLKQHKEWIPFINGKNVLISLKYKYDVIKDLDLLFEKYGDKEAIRIGTKNPESVMKMLEEHRFDDLSSWYDKLHYVPHYIVMKEFPFEQSDKFMVSNKKWLQLMKIERHNLTEDSKSALLKASMCFGVFDNDMAGFQETIKLFSDIPRTLSEQNYQNVINYLKEQIESIEDNENQLEQVQRYNNELDLMQKCYKQDDEGIYTLRINSQQDKKSSSILRTVMEDADIPTILTADKSHKLFGGFIMKYDPDFRDFLLKNIDTILSSDEYISYISSMQKQWSEIKLFNSNRVLTLDLAMAYIKSNQFENVQVGNENLAELSNMAGYNQEDFDVLQQIYNYGKARVFNSIPRISFKKDGYNCEIVKLDDAMPLVVGTLSDCCQELGDAAEVSMEHSITSEHGRLLVIKDEAGNIVAQSWVWRNKNVLCFDNIEIPDKAFTRAERSGTSSEEFADTIYELYKQAGEELIKKDEISYDKLLEEEKITKEQYEALKLAKVTVGIGYNDIAESLERNSKLDESVVARPLNFVPPVDLSNTLYTSDSRKQFIIAGQQDVKDSSFETPILYSDEFIIHDDSNTTERDALTLEKLEIVTNGEDYYENIYYDDSDRIVSDIAYNYDLNPDTTRIIMNANFAIIYDKNGDNIVIGDLLYNTSFDNQGQIVDISDKVTMQIRMALEQIGVIGKTVDTSSLNAKKMEMYEKAISLKEEIDIERGISHGTR